MKRKSLAKNYIYNLIYQILIIILPLITTPYISRVLGAQNIGIYSYTISITTYFITFGTLGIALYGKREIAYVQNDKKKYSKVFWEINLLRLVTLTISMIIFYFMFISNNNDYQTYYKILTLELFATLLDISWFFNGLEEFKKIVVRNTIIKLISIVCIFLFVKTPNDLTIYLVIYVLSNFIGNLSLWFYLPKFLCKIDFKKLNIFKHLKPTISLFIPQIAIQVYTLLDKTMIGTIIENKNEVGFYDQSQKIIKLLLTVITAFGTVMMPRIANLHANGDKENIKKNLLNSFNLVFMLSFPMIFGIISISGAFVPIFFGEGYDKVIYIMSVICPIILFIGLSNITGNQFLLPTKRQNQFTISVVIGAIVNFIINLLLIPDFGALGASIGTVIAELSVMLVQMYFVRNDFNFKDLIKLSYKYLFASLFMFFICIIVSRLIYNNFISVILQVIIGTITYVLVLICLNDSFTMNILNKIFKRFKHDKK